MTEEQPDPMQGLHNAEIYLLATANFGRDKVKEGNLGLVQYVDRLYNAMLSWYSTKASVQEKTNVPDAEIPVPLIIQFCGGTISGCYERVVAPIVEKEKNLEGDYPEQNEFLQGPIFRSESNIDVFFDTLAGVVDNAELVPEYVRSWYSSDATRFHAANGGKCTSDGGQKCPGTSTCSFAVLVANRGDAAGAVQTL